MPEQAFLTGRSLHLRGVATTDAASVNRWRNTLFPMNPDLAEEKVRDAITSDAQERRYTMIAFRRTDSSPVGSAMCWLGNSVWVYLSIHAWPALDDQLRQEIQAEILEIVVDFLLSEHKHYAVLVEIPQRSQLFENAALRIGMRTAYQLREAPAYRGGRVDLIAYEALNPQAAARFGDPEPPVFGSVQRQVRSPAPREWPAPAGDLPDNAVIVGKRLFLRPVRLDDTRSMAQWAMLEQET